MWKKRNVKLPHYAETHEDLIFSCVITSLEVQLPWWICLIISKIKKKTKELSSKLK